MVFLTNGRLKTMPSFSKKSQDKLSTCHPSIIKVLKEAIKHVDFTILEGIRTPERQQELMDQGKTKTLNSKHLPNADGLSMAVDIIAYPIDWNDRERNLLFAGYIKGLAKGMGVDLRIGSDWDGDFYTNDQTFNDDVHFELKS